MSVVINKQFGYQPWSLVNRLQRDIERTFAREFGEQQDSQTNDNYVVDWTPPVDVRETKDGFVLAIDVPGVNPQDIEVTTENGLLTIRGVRHQETATQNGTESNGSIATAAQPIQTRTYQRVERTTGRFLRRFTLPETANIDGVVAKTSHGVLTLTIPKRAEVQPRRIEIQAA